MICRQCENCRRRQSVFLLNKYGENSYYSIEFEQHPRNTIKGRKKLKFLQSSRTDQSPVTLCYECARFLTNDATNINNKSFSVVWPAFFWGLLGNKDVQLHYGINVWKFISQNMRYWWIDGVKQELDVYDDVTLEQPEPIFVDKTMDIIEMNEGIQSNLLARLAEVTNKHLLPTVLCPWGCSEYPFKCGHMELDFMFQRHLLTCELSIVSDSKNFNLTISCRDDYVRFADEYEVWLLNPDWKVLPSIAFVEGKGPCILTCRNHNGGTNKMYIHPPRQPDHILPSFCGD